MSDLRELYQQVILDHNKNPRNFHAMPDASRTVDGYNPLCGDHYTIFLRLDGETIREVSFTGSGCAISKASASVMSSTVKGKSKEEAGQLFDTFHRLVTGDASGLSAAELGRLAAFSGVSEFPARVKCATLAWHTLRSALEGTEEKVSTE
ncbi:MAG: SUF system NifU family Fe-S cluster assembly protein [Acidobacteria bacterium]|nr:SUF system NifU family Fe-S cluster assembly protein [Acidobacteriota bacterium]MBV9477223.1 SUF system NifU family Fe-S cluster assembly protein [Acidobacteriota bacterium]